MKRTMLASTVFLLGAVATLAQPCASSSTALCLSANRFELTVAWKDFQGNTGTGQAVSLTPDTGYFWFFSASNVELIVKVLDARALNGKFWVFFGALSNVQYDLTVRDSATGGTKTYHNPSGQFASVGDTSAFDGGSGATASRETVTIAGSLAPPESLAAIQRFVGASVAVSATAEAQADFTPCLAPVTNLFLSNCRFKVEASWQDFQGGTGDGQAVQLTGDTGYFWFFSPTNVELVVKVLDARGVNGDFWVFYGALSNVQYRITVTDTLSGDVKVYSNQPGNFASVGDTSAFQPGPSVSIVRNDALAVSGRFDSTGGTLTATGADGTQFILTLPPNALVFPLRITMTPVSGVTGAVLGGPLQAAVQMEPDGLLLMEQADLRIVPPAAPNLKTLAYFRYRGPGESFTPYPGVPKATGIEMPVSYLAGYGAAMRAASGSASSPERGRRLESSGALAPYIARAADLWQRNNNGEFSDINEYLSELYQVWSDAWKNAVEPALQGLGDQCDLATLRSVFEMAMEFHEFDPETDPSYGAYNAEIFAKIKEQALHCIDIAYQRCKSDNDPSQVGFMEQCMALLQRLGLVSDAENQEVWDKIEKCLRFEIDFEAAFSANLGGVDERLKVRAIVPVRLEAIDNKFILSGGNTISHEFINAVGDPCSGSAATQPGWFIVTRMDIGIFLAPAAEVTAADRAANRSEISVDMIYAPGDPLEQWTWTCPLIGSQTGPWQPVFRSLYGEFHADEAVPGTDGDFIVIHWEPVRSGSIFAKLQYVRTLGGGLTDSEETYVFLKHTPQ
jgi:hypothetical protein